MNKLNSQKGFVVPLVIAIIAILIAGGVYMVWKSRSAPTTSVSNQTNNNVTSHTYDISDLGVKFNLPDTLSDLTYKFAHFPGDQAVNSVAFGSKTLESAGCAVDTAPLGYLTYDNDKGGVIVAYARGSNLIDPIYYVKPNGQCKTNVSAQVQTLQESLKSLVSDYVQSTGTTSDWKTYHSDLWGFEMSYPSDWTYEATKAPTIFSIKSSREGYVYVIDSSTIGCDNRDWTITLDDAHENKFICKKSGDKNLSIELVTTESNSEKAIEDQIAASFKLAN